MQAWMLDERKHAGPEHLDAGFVAGYDRKQGHPDPTPEIDAFRACGLDRDATIIDLAAGTGQSALPAAAEFGRVIAIDVSPAMVAFLRREAARSGVANLEVVQAGFLGYRHEGALADGIHTRHALHQLPDFWKAIALDRMASVLRPGGVLRVRDLIYDCTPRQAPTLLQEWFAGAAVDPAEGYTAEEYAEHVRTEHSTFRWLFEPMLAVTGFDIVTVEFQASVYGSYTCIRR